MTADRFHLSPLPSSFDQFTFSADPLHASKIGGERNPEIFRQTDVRSERFAMRQVSEERLSREQRAGILPTATVRFVPAGIGIVWIESVTAVPPSAVLASWAVVAEHHETVRT